MYSTEIVNNASDFSKKSIRAMNRDSNQFLQLLTFAIQNSFSQYCNRERAINQLKTQETTCQPKKVKTSKSEVIQISSDEQPEEISINHKGNKKIFEIRATLDRNYFQQQSDCDSKKNVLKTQPTSPTVPRSELPLQVKNSGPVSNNDSMVDQADQDISFTQFDIECPLTTMKHSQILNKRQSLLLRQVTDWEKVTVKARKQRRQIRMLFN